MNPSKPRPCSRCTQTFKRVKTKSELCEQCRPNPYRKKLDLGDIKGAATRRNWLLRTRGHACEGCGLSEWLDFQIPLEVDHIDGNHENNVETNLRLLCANCHACTPTYKNRNRGRGRHSRRFRYMKGLSY
jgi:hypothetical protein